MKRQIYKDLKKRKCINNTEIKKNIYKSLLCLSTSVILKKKIQYKLNILKKNSSKARINNRCIISGRNHSIYRLFKMSRIKFRELSLAGHLFGVKKASW